MNHKLKIPIFRMTHISNIEYILNNGMWAMNSGIQDLTFTPIGNTDIINKRKDYAVKAIPPGGVLGDYVPFYFDGHSPMLLNIITGYGVPQTPQKDIVFIVCDAEEIMNSDCQWCFTDGHAKKAITRFFNKKEDMQRLDWNTIKADYWQDTEEDNDRQRKKMAEFLVLNHVPTNLIRCIVTHTSECTTFCQDLIATVGLSIPVFTDSTHKLYYRHYD